MFGTEILKGFLGKDSSGYKKTKNVSSDFGGRLLESFREKH